MIVTSREDIFARCWHYHNSGRTLSSDQLLGGEVLVGTNGRMAEWEAAILDAQMDRLDEQCARRQENGEWLNAQLARIPEIAVLPADDRITYWNGYIFAFHWQGRMSRGAFVEALNAEGIPASSGYPLLNRMGMLSEPGFERSTGRKFVDDAPLPNAEKLAQRMVWIPGCVLLADRETVARVAEAVAKVAAADSER